MFNKSGVPEGEPMAYQIDTSLLRRDGWQHGNGFIKIKKQHT